MCRGVRNNVMDEPLIILFKNCSLDPDNVKSLNELLEENNIMGIFQFIISGSWSRTEKNNKVTNHHLTMLMDQICLFYCKQLNQRIVDLPNVENIICDPEKYFDDTHLYLLLLFGCATQCGVKNWFYNRIAELDSENFFIVLMHLKHLKTIVEPREINAVINASRKFLKQLSRSLRIGNKKESLDVNNDNQPILSCEDGKCDECADCTFTNIYKKKIQRSDDMIGELESQLECQKSLINKMKDIYKNELEFQEKVLHFATNAFTNESTEDKSIQTPDWMLSNDESNTQTDSQYKIQMYKTLLTQISKEWEDEENKYKNLSEEISRMKQLIVNESTIVLTKNENTNDILWLNRLN